MHFPTLPKSKPFCKRFRWILRSILLDEGATQTSDLHSEVWLFREARPETRAALSALKHRGKEITHGTAHLVNTLLLLSHIRQKFSDSKNVCISLYKYS